MIRLALLATLAACVDLPTIPSPVCGNGVVEAGEDCDGGPGCVACGQTCTVDDDCALLGGASRCAALDHLCHAPSGQFGALSGAQPFDVRSFLVTDVDGDHVGDVVGLSTTHVDTRYGDPAGTFAAFASTETPDITGPASTLPANTPTAIDLLLPTADGIVAFGSPSGVVAPYALAFSNKALDDSGIPLAVMTLDAGKIAVLGRTPRTGPGTIFLVVADQSSVMNATVYPMPCGAPLDDATFETAKVQVFDATGDPLHPAVAIAFAAGNPMQTCAFMLVDDGATVTQSKPLLIDMPGVLADLDGDRCPELLVQDSATQYLSTRDPGGGCTFSTSSTAFAPPPDGHAPIGSIHLTPVPAGLRSEALVTTNTIWAFETNGAYHATPLYTSSRPVDTLRVADIDRDGKLDAILASSTATDIDVLFRRDDGFLRYRIGTDAPPANVVTGDFDGNGAADIIYTERIASGDRLSGIYGTPDLPVGPNIVGEIDPAVGIAVVNLTDSTDRGMAIDDLAMLERLPDGHSVYQAYYGQPNRAMIPYFDPTTTHDTVFRAVGAATASDGRTEIVSIDEVPDPLPMGVTATLHVSYGRPVSNTLVVEAATGTHLSLRDVGKCSEGKFSVVFCLDDARLLLWRDGTQDFVIGIDPVTPESIVAGLPDPTAPQQGCTPTSPCPSPVVNATTTQAMATLVVPPFIDADNNVIVSSSSKLGGDIERCTPKGVFNVLTHMWDTSMTCSDLLGNDPIDHTCTMAVPGRVDPSGAQGIVLACATPDGGGALYRYAADGSQLLATLPFMPLYVQVADTTGDGVDDLIVTGPGVVTALYVLRQRTSREVE